MDPKILFLILSNIANNLKKTSEELYSNDPKLETISLSLLATSKAINDTLSQLGPLLEHNCPPAVFSQVEDKNSPVVPPQM